MKRLFVTGLIALMLESCAPIGNYQSVSDFSEDDATHFVYRTKNQTFYAYVTKTGCEKPCEIVIEEFEINPFSGVFSYSAKWVLTNSGNKVPYEVQRYSPNFRSVMNLQERDVDARAIPLDTLKARFNF